MKAYKFRGADQIPFALDILLKNRLHCADWGTFNDPLEGFFGYSYSPDKEQEVRKKIARVITEKQSLRICSLSLTYNDHLLWSHYASGFRGLALECELPDRSDEIKVVEYQDMTDSVSLDMDKQLADPAPITAKEIFRSKYKPWKYEEEVRVIQSSEWYTLPHGVSRLICGHRMNDAMFEAFKIICEQKNIPIARISIGPDKLQIKDI